MKPVTFFAMLAALALLTTPASVEAGALVYPGTNYCGPGNRGGEPKSKLDAACKEHDESPAYSQGKWTDKYLPGFGSAERRTADIELIRKADAVRRDRTQSQYDRGLATRVETFFGARLAVDRAVDDVKEGVRRLRNRFGR